MLLFNNCNNTRAIFWGSSPFKGWLVFQAVPTHWSHLWNMPVNKNSCSKHFSWWDTYSLQRKLFANTTFQTRVPWLWSLEEDEWNFSVWEVAYAQLYQLCNSFYKIPLTEEQFSNCFGGWIKKACPVLFFQPFYTFIIYIERNVLKAMDVLKFIHKQGTIPKLGSWAAETWHQTNFRLRLSILDNV